MQTDWGGFCQLSIENEITDEQFDAFLDIESERLSI
jgi:hypothetical protein